MKKPSVEDFDVAAEWLSINEGDLGEMESCRRVAEWLSHLSDSAVKAEVERTAVNQVGIPVRQARQILKRAALRASAGGQRGD